MRVIPFRALEFHQRAALGSGSFGEVRLAWWSGGHCDVAVKANGIACANTEAIRNETALLEVLLTKPHRNVITVYGVCTDAPDGAARLVMAYCACGSLELYLRSQVRKSLRWL